MNEQQRSIETFLSENNINFSAHYVGETVKENNWQCDAWRISFQSGNNQMETDYFAGLGHRKPVKGAEIRPEAKYPKKSVGYAAWVKMYVKPVTPCVADVLYSIIADSTAIDANFEYWCSDYGYSSDSISAFNTYQACCKIAKDLHRVFTRAQIETLRGLLEDY